MTNEEFYGSYYNMIRVIDTAVETMIYNSIHDAEDTDKKLVKYISHRIKSAESAIAKLTRHGIECTADNAMQHLTDIVGYRVVVRFLSDMYVIQDRIEKSEFMHIINVKDYVSHPKSNGYRAIHLIVHVEISGQCMPIEIQLRTMAMDCWASLEHQVCYKQNVQNREEIVALMKECADKMLEVDKSMDDTKARMQLV